ncbi:MAG: serine hydrolase domain-containing protein [Acidobacteriota bacterium]
MRVQKRGGRALLGALLLSTLVPCVSECTPPKAVVVDDFESGKLAGWRTAHGGSGDWFVYSDGKTPPDPSRTDPSVPFDVPNPPQGKFAAVTDMQGGGTRILYRDLKLDGRFRLRLTVFYVNIAGELASPKTLDFNLLERNQQFRIDLMPPASPVDSMADSDVLLNVFHTSPGDPARREPTAVEADLSALAGKTVRLRLAGADNTGPFRIGVDEIRLEPLDADARAELPASSTEPPGVVNGTLTVPRMKGEEALAALSTYADQLVKNDQFSGTLLVARHGKVLFQKAWGRANRETGAPVTLDTQFRIGSMNKMFTSVATLQLVEAGKLALDEPIGKYLTDYPNKETASKVTIRHLLTHTGGTGDIFGPEFMENRLTLRQHGDYVKLFGSRAPAYEPGTRFEYSNYGFILLGAILERVSGMSYFDSVRSRVFQPAGMASTDSLPESESVPNRAAGYTRGETGWVSNAETLPWSGTSAGGGYSTVGDLLRFAQALESGKLISKATFAEAVTARSEWYGYGFMIQDEGRLRSYGHNGGAPGINGDLRIFPETGYVLVGLSNLDPPAASHLLDYFAARMPID